ncbi:histidine phosphatase family protein [Phenylobacterium sp.]|jgi:probable phosphoglycerate mutase|uniref:histidine phosphatase family protein n=1 Tax=Phenylobacterium sp. TaxID=1871053 RepID=UPI002F4059EC
MKDIYVVTHTQSRHHIAGLVGGWYDAGLTDLGRMQAGMVASRLQDVIGGSRPLEIYASDLLRAAETAQIISARLSVEAKTTSDLREMNYGGAGGKPQTWFNDRVVRAPKIGNRLDHRGGIEDAETKREVITRVYRAMDMIIESPCPTQIIVTHGYTLTFVVAAWVKMPVEAAGYINMRSSPGGITHLREDDEWFNRYVMSLNVMTHMAEPSPDLAS